MNTFYSRLDNQWGKGNFVCVGLDSEAIKIPDAGAFGRGEIPSDFILDFNKRIIRQTAHVAGAYKPNAAFYESRGPSGWSLLRDTFAYIENEFPDIIKIFDAKRADIGNTNRGYVEAAFNYLKADAITINPFFGQEALEPFLKMGDKGIIVLCKTSNQGGGEFQDRLSLVPWEELSDLTKDFSFDEIIARGFYEGVDHWRDFRDLGVLMPLSHLIALRVSRKWNYNGNCALVVGAPYPEYITKIRFLAPELPLLIPGIGAQGGDVEKTVKAADNKKGDGFLVNSAREIIFNEDPRKAAENLSKLINQFR